jgi:hypothetical protein
MKNNFYRVVTDAGEYFLKMPERYFAQFLETMNEPELIWEEITELPPGSSFLL